MSDEAPNAEPTEPDPEPAPEGTEAPPPPEGGDPKPSDQEVLDAVKLLYDGAPHPSEDLAAAGAVLYAWARA